MSSLKLFHEVTLEAKEEDKIDYNNWTWVDNVRYFESNITGCTNSELNCVVCVNSLVIGKSFIWIYTSRIKLLN